MARPRPETGKPPAPRGAPSTWPVFLKTHAVLIDRVEQRLRAGGLPELSWYDVMWSLEQAEGGRLRMHELAEATVITRSNMTRLVDRMASAGFVVRERVGADRRGAYAVLTPDGRAQRREMWKTYSQAIDDHFDGQLSRPENATLRTLLLRLLANARELHPT